MRVCVTAPSHYQALASYIAHRVRPRAPAGCGKSPPTCVLTFATCKQAASPVLIR